MPLKVSLKNNTKSMSRKGTLCKVDPLDSNSFILLSAGDTSCLGVIAENKPYRAVTEIITSGEAQVWVNDNAIKGSLIRALKSSDRASQGQARVAKASDTQYLLVGTALESGKGLIRINFAPQYCLSTLDYVPYNGATDNVNIGDYFLTGRFIARPGNAAIGLAPLIFQAGDLLTVPEAGTMEFDGTGIYLTPTNHRRFISLASDSIIVSITATTIAPTTLWTGITNANELKAHRVYVIKACGLYTTDAVDVATITLKFGATTIGSITTPVGVAVSEPWYLEIFLTVRTIGINGTISAFGKFEASVGATYGVLESFVIDTTIANDLTIICAWSDVGNGLKLTQAWLSTAD